MNTKRLGCFVTLQRDITILQSRLHFDQNCQYFAPTPEIDSPTLKFTATVIVLLLAIICLTRFTLNVSVRK